MSQSVYDIAMCFTQKSKEEKSGISKMKLLKLCYIAYGFYIAYTDKKLFNNRIEAWQYGPVIPDLYHLIKFEGTNVSEDILKLYDATTSNINKEVSIVLEVVWEIYGDLTGGQLSNLTHKKDTPWDSAYNTTSKRYHAFGNPLISTDSIKKHYNDFLGGIFKKNQNDI